MAQLHRHLNRVVDMATKRQTKKTPKETIKKATTAKRTTLVIFEPPRIEPASGATSEWETYSLSVRKRTGDVILRERTRFIDHRKDNGREDSSDRYRISPLKLIEWIRKNGELISAR